MAHQVIELECPGCGSPISITTKQCPQCFREIVISTFNSISSMTNLELNKYASAYRKALAGYPNNKDLNLSIAFCYLKLKLYDKALPCFEKAIEDNFDNSEVYFYAAISLLKGKKAFLMQRPTINQIEEYLQAATMIESKGIYYYFWAYIKYDYYVRKHLITSPTYQEMLEMAHQYGYSEADMDQLYALLGVERPSCL